MNPNYKPEAETAKLNKTQIPLHNSLPQNKHTVHQLPIKNNLKFTLPKNFFFFRKKKKKKTANVRRRTITRKMADHQSTCSWKAERSENRGDQAAEIYRWKWRARRASPYLYC